MDETMNQILRRVGHCVSADGYGEYLATMTDYFRGSQLRGSGPSRNQALADVHTKWRTAFKEVKKSRITHDK